MTTASTTTIQPVSVPDANAADQANGSKEIPAFAKTFCGVVKGDFGLQQTDASDVPATPQQMATKSNPKVISGFEWINAEHARWASAITAVSDTVPAVETGIPKNGLTKKRVDDAIAASRQAIVISIPEAQVTTIANVILPTEISEKGKPEEANLERQSSLAVIEGKTKGAVFEPDLFLVKGEPARPSQQSTQIANKEEMPAVLGLPVSSSTALAATKDANESGASLFHPGSGKLSPAGSDDAAQVAPGFSATAIDFQTVRALKDVIETHAQDPVGAPGKKARQTVAGGESRGLLEMPAATVGTSGVAVESNQLKGALAQIGVEGHARAANSDPFVVMDSSSLDPEPQLIHTSRHEIEVGIHDPTYGWVEVKTHKYGGEITASLSTSSSESQRNLQGQLTAMTEYLSTRDIPISRVVMESMNASNPGGEQSGQSPSGGQSQGSQDETLVMNAVEPQQPGGVDAAELGQYRNKSQIHLMA